MKRIGSLFVNPLFVILICAAFWRFDNYLNRLVLSQDQGRDAIIGLFAIKDGYLPPIGPPSSAGPFSFGPIYYWLISTFFLITHFNLYAPWIGFTLLSFGSVVLSYFLGKKLFNHSFGVILGLVAAFSSTSVVNSANVLNPMLVESSTVLALFSLVYLVNSKRWWWALLMGVSVGLAANFHLQALGLISLGLVVFLPQFDLASKVKIGLSFSLGLFLTFLPIIYFDLRSGGVWSKGLMYYLSVGQYRFYLPVRWLTEIKDFWPILWGQTIAQIGYSGYLFIALFLIALAMSVRSKALINRTWVVIAVAFLVQVVLVRYYKGPRLSIYLIMFIPFIEFFTAWSMWVIYTKSKLLGILLVGVTLLVCSYMNFHLIQGVGNFGVLQEMKQELAQKTQNAKIDLYQFKASGNISMPITYLLYHDGLLDPSGMRLGVCENTQIRTDSGSTFDNCPGQLELLVKRGSFGLYNLNNLTAEQIKTIGFENITAQGVVDSLYISYPHLIKKR